jgi:hypothetical protein
MSVLVALKYYMKFILFDGPQNPEASFYEDCIGNGTSFSPSSLVFSCHYHCPSVPYLLSQTLCNVSNWQQH